MAEFDWQFPVRAWREGPWCLLVLFMVTGQT